MYYSAMTTFGEVETRAKHLGLRVDTVRGWKGRDLYWLVGGANWVTTDPGRPLAEIARQLDALEKSA